MKRWSRFGCVVAVFGLTSADMALRAGPIPDTGVLTLTPDRHVDLPCPDLRIVGAPVTVQTWVRTRSAGILFACGWENREPGPQAGYMLYFGGGGRIRFGVNNSARGFTNAQWDDLTSDVAVNDGQWHQITGVFPGDGTSRVRLYIDGEQASLLRRAGAAQPPLQAYTETEPPARIGLRNDPLAYRQNGRYGWDAELDEMRIWKLALSQEQIQADLRREIDPATPGLIAYWKFNEERLEKGDTVHDATGRNHGRVARYSFKPVYPLPSLPLDPVAFPEDDFNYSRYPEAITGYNGQDRQRIAQLDFAPARRVRVGARGNYKASFVTTGPGRFVATPCRLGPHPEKPDTSVFQIVVLASIDDGRTWTEIAKPGIFAKEPCLERLPDGTLFLIAQDADFSKERRHPYTARSRDNGHTWEFEHLENEMYPRQIVVEPDGAILFAIHNGSWHLQLAQSRDAGRTWQFREGQIAWGPGEASRFDEVALTRLRSGELLAAFRRCIPGYTGEGFEHSMLTRSTDNGRTWSRPVQISAVAEVHYQIIELADGRLLASYSNYHLPYGAWAVLSTDGGRTWNRDRLLRLALSAGIHSAWPVTRQLADGSMATIYAAELYAEQPEPNTVTEFLHWQLP